MKIRITGTRRETELATENLASMFRFFPGGIRYALRDVSDFYPNRGNSTLGRVYLDVDLEDPLNEGGEAR